MTEDGESPLQVLYDRECGLCRRLAEYGRVRSQAQLTFISWQEFITYPEATKWFSDEALAEPISHLRVLSGEMVLEDRAAWEAILSAYPPFESLSWIAERLGLLGAVSRVTYYGGKWARSMCGSCR